MQPLGSPHAPAAAAIVDVDGTLVDSNYHHALCWFRAFREHELVVPLWRLHRHVGMGGDEYVAAVCNDEVEERVGDSLRARWEELFDTVIDEVEPIAGAPELIAELKARGRAVVIASSSIERHLDVLLDKLGVRDIVDGWTTKDDVDRSKPHPDLVEAALQKAGTGDAVMIGDSPWDIEAATRAAIPTLAVFTGGFCRSELSRALAVHDSVAGLREQLDATPLR
jgi:HAD superfamily hydrolase (TIGR01549 family)